MRHRELGMTFLVLLMMTFGAFVSAANHFSPKPSQERAAATQGNGKSGPFGAAYITINNSDIWLDVFTLAVAIGSIALCGIAYLQWKDSRILQRAHITIKPLGIEPFTSGDGRVACHIGIYNAGKLPATSVTWALSRELYEVRNVKEFSLKGMTQDGNIVIAPGDEVRKNCAPYHEADLNKFVSSGLEDDRWFFMWGRVEYIDGFKRRRFTEFCHRYNINGRFNLDTQRGNWTIHKKHGRYHEYGNGTDEV